ncbi:hypothetical protein HBI25_108210 [Parastagonospora nodorum]|nr:hypothetical protein HBH43_046420 [Parastagonospora nodorum]KAH4205617.1 hypothetical protein HBI95_129140 [Parastagonospora nodorum]KAH5113404.1 hypothetical protein HBH72_002910 [Parastagonospora nodorum]KAH5257397.1 hypothetical protein HBI72_123930 [Parastagonospora nodorum]KAH5560915.1 hypothetical protein HBI25_108210 [Parastagonospora nodorum]
MTAYRCDRMRRRMIACHTDPRPRKNLPWTCESEISGQQNDVAQILSRRTTPPAKLQQGLGSRIIKLSCHY